MATSTEKNHNKHLDLLQDYKIHLIKYVAELEKMDRESEFLKKWNEEIILERKKEIQVIDKILKNMIRF
ncbi:hypothetical protein OAA51_04090 [Nitrosopumilus sp.]|jgi:hypothetical protein|nr:hypothetical protein [Nitrosopumilus sp.]|tara:strand:- start:177 stop:383 length:207 start_codon:yes stop_codon:yes gene_type:complete